MKYKVLKEFIGRNGPLFVPGAIITKNQPMNYDAAAFYEGLLDHGFIEKIKDEPWKPNYGDEYWYMDEDGEIFREDEWNRDHDYDGDRLQLGNVFQTKEQAKKAVEWLKAFKVLRDDTKDFKPDWKNEDRKYWVFWNDTAQALEVNSDIDWAYCLIYFATEADAKESIKKHSDAWKIFLGIEEDKE